MANPNTVGINITPSPDGKNIIFQFNYNGIQVNAAVPIEVHTQLIETIKKAVSDSPRIVIPNG